MKKLLFVLTALTVISLSLNFWTVNKNSSIGFVRSADLFENYHGRIEATNLYEQKLDIWQASLDTLGSSYKISLQKYNEELPTLSREAKTLRVQQLYAMEQNYVQHKQEVEARMQEEDAAMTDGVLNQINAFVQKYGEEQGYDIILATGNSGNILFGVDGIDLTDEILAGLNKELQN